MICVTILTGIDPNFVFKVPSPLIPLYNKTLSPVFEVFSKLIFGVSSRHPHLWQIIVFIGLPFYIDPIYLYQPKLGILITLAALKLFKFLPSCEGYFSARIVLSNFFSLVDNNSMNRFTKEQSLQIIKFLYY